MYCALVRKTVWTRPVLHAGFPSAACLRPVYSFFVLFKLAHLAPDLLHHTVVVQNIFLEATTPLLW